MRIITLFLVLLLTACGGSAMSILNEASETLGEVSDKSADSAAKAIDGYCEAVPEDMRADLRDSINSRTVNGDISIECNVPE